MASPEPTRVLRVAMDSLVYTRDGLQTPNGIELSVGHHNKIIVERPPLRPAIGSGRNGFPRDLSYPLPATLSLFWGYSEPGSPFTHHKARAAVDGLNAFQVFGHASESGDEPYNKRLSDRRADVGLALLSGDPAQFASVAEEENWGARELQAMLRTLACDPGPIDDEIGPRTESAIATFQERHNRGVYHRRSRSHPRADDLAVDGKLDETVTRAIMGAFVSAHGAHRHAETHHPTHASCGCSEFNLIDGEHHPSNRRLAIVGYPDAPQHDHIPCTRGDDGACAIVDDSAPRCLWYRLHVEEPQGIGPRFYDARWLWLGDDRYLLSALTNVDPEQEVDFRVFESDRRVRTPFAETPVWFSETRGEVVRGRIRRGVAQAVWSSGVSPETQDGRPPFAGVPTFRVGHVGSTAHTFASYPETQTVRLLVSCTDPSRLAEREDTYHLWTGDGAYDQVAAIADAVVVSPHRVAVEFHDVPLDSRVSLSLGIGPQRLWPVFENVVVESMLGNVEIGSASHGVAVESVPPEEEGVDPHPDAARPRLEGSGEPEEDEVDYSRND